MPGVGDKPPRYVANSFPRSAWECDIGRSASKRLQLNQDACFQALTPAIHVTNVRTLLYGTQSVPSSRSHAERGNELTYNLKLKTTMAPLDKQRQTFKEEAYDLLGELEAALLELEESPDNQELIGRVFRAMHTIKGSGAMFGFDDVSRFTHEIETIYDQARSGKIAVTKELVKVTLSARDHIREMLDAYSGGIPVDKAKTKEIIAMFSLFLPPYGEMNTACGNTDEPPRPAALPEETTETQGELPQKAVVYRIRFRPAPSIFMNGTNPVCLLAALRALGDCETVAYTEKIPSLEEINPELCYTYWDIVLSTTEDINAIKDIFVFVMDDCELDVKTVDDTGKWGAESEKDYKKLGEILIERGDVGCNDLQKALHTQKRIGEILVESGAIEREHVQSALAEQHLVREYRAKQQSLEPAFSIRVAAAKLDNFVDLIGELVIVQQRLSQTASVHNSPELSSIAEEVERLAVELRDSAMSVRMLPIGTLFGKFRRMVHDLSRELGRSVELTADGAETELDKTVIEQLSDPLMHLIRNSIDHGIEPPDVRVAAGKPAFGTLHLSAAHAGSNVIIQIRDDGKGLDAAAIRSKAVEKCLIRKDAEMPEKEILSFIFLPGFSTAKKITSVSGRGVGLDVVKRTIDALRGTIEISSRSGKGTSISIKLPLTLAIIEGLHVESGGEHYVFPLSAVEECVELVRADAVNSPGRRLANIRGGIVPYVRLKDWFMITGESPAIEQIVVTKTDGGRIGFVVDNVIGEHQTVIKPLGRIYRDVTGFSGATILGDGRLALILDVPQLIHDIESSPP